VDTSTGEVIWTSKWFNSHPHSSPALDLNTGYIFVGCNGGVLFALDPKTGQVIWEYDAGGEIKSTPAVHRDKVVFTSWSKKIIALDTKTGSEIWTADLKGRSQSSPSYIPDENLWVAGSSFGEMVAVDDTTGEVRWRHQGNFTRMLGSALVTNIHGSKMKWGIWYPCQLNTLCLMNPKNGTIIKKYLLGELLSGEPVTFNGSLFVALENFGGLVKLSDALD